MLFVTSHLNLDVLLLLLLDRDRNVPEKILKLGGLPIRTLVADTDKLNHTEPLKCVIYVRYCLIAKAGMGLSAVTSQIEVTKGMDAAEKLRLVCPTEDCSATPRDWVYPNEVAQPPDAWGRRVIRVIDKSGESFIVCGKAHAYSRRGSSQRCDFGSTTAA